jgi:hypothetical protein
MAFGLTRTIAPNPPQRIKIAVCVFRSEDAMEPGRCRFCTRHVALSCEQLPKGASWQYPPKLLDGVCPSKLTGEAK